MSGPDRKDFVRDYVARNEPHPLAPYPPLLINACLSGSVPTRDMTPYAPISPEEIVEDAVRVYDAGARIVHVHARDEEGLPTWRGDVYEKIFPAIRRERPGLICCATTSGRRWSEFEKRVEVLDLDCEARPDMASLTLGSMNFPNGPSVTSIDEIERLAAHMAERGVRPELEVFDIGMIGVARFLERKGVIEGRKYFNILLGNLGTLPATMGNLARTVEALPENSTWAATGIGVFQLPMNMAAITAGGGVRVGIEDSIYYDIFKTRLASNEELVMRIVKLGKELDRAAATPEQAREMVGLA